MHLGTSGRRRLAAGIASTVLALATAGTLDAQQPPRTQPTPPPRTVQPDSGRARILGSDTTRNRRAANQDAPRATGGAQAGDSAAGAGGGGALANVRLRSIGPAMISGRISDVAVHPKDKKTWYVGVAAGGVWKTTNAGTTFTPVFDRESSYSIANVVIDERNPNVVWVGTGENNAQRAVNYGDGVYKSVDGGRSWTNMGLKESEHIGKIVIDPRNSDVVYVASQGPLSAKGGDRGLYKTVDGGRSWKKVLDGGTWAGVSDVVLDPRDPDVLVATTWQRVRRTYGYIAGGPESGVWRSTDGGATWKRSQTGIATNAELGRIGLAISPVNPDVIYAVLEAADNSGGFYRSRDAGVSWEKMSNYTNIGLYYSELTADPVDVDRVYAVDVRNMVSDDGGRTFRPVGERNKHVDNHSIWIDPADVDHMLMGSDGGLYETFDRGQTYKFFTNLPLGQFYRVDVDNAMPFYNVLGGTQDNNSLRGKSRTRSPVGITNADWVITAGGDGFVSRADPTNPNIVYAESQHGNLQRFDLTTGESVNIVPQPEPGEDALRWYWDSPMIVSPHRNTRIYFAAQRLYRSDDRGDSWTAVSPDLSRKIDRNRLKLMDRTWSVDAVARNTSSSFFGAIVAVAESPLKEGLLWIGTDDGTIQVSENGGQAWRRAAAPPGVPDTTQVARVHPSRHDASTAYAAFDNHMSGDYKPYVLKTTDMGRTWTSIAGNLPQRGTVYVVIDDPKDPNILYAGTEFGLFFTRDGGRSWTRLRGGLPTIQVRDLAIQEREDDLVVATFGRSFYVLDDLAALRAATPQLLAREAAILPMRRTPMYTQSNTLAGGYTSALGSQYYAAPNPPTGAVITYHLRSTLQTRRAQRQSAERAAVRRGTDVFFPSWDSLRVEDREEAPAIIVTITDGTGAVVRRLTGPAQAGLQRVVWDLRYPSSTPAPRGGAGGGGGGGGGGGEDDDDGPRFGGGAGPLVVPGTYTASLAKRVDGVTTPIGEPRTFEVYMLDSTVSRSPAVLAFQQQVSNLQRAVLGANALVGELTDRVQTLTGAVQQTPAASPKLAEDVRALELRLRDLREAFAGDPTLARRQEPTPPSLIGRVGVMAGAARGIGAPTATQRRQYEIVAADFAGVLARVRTLAETDLKRVETAAESAGVPWTPGRLPEWRATP